MRWRATCPTRKEGSQLASKPLRAPYPRQSLAEDRARGKYQGCQELFAFVYKTKLGLPEDLASWSPPWSAFPAHPLPWARQVRVLLCFPTEAFWDSSIGVAICSK